MDIILNEKQLKEVEEFAQLESFGLEDICLAVGISYEEGKREFESKEGHFYKAILRGRLLSKAQHAQKIKTLSKQGSSPAQTLALKMQKDREYFELLNSYGRN